MKVSYLNTACLALCIFLSFSTGNAQSRKNRMPDNKYINMIPGSPNSNFRRIELYSEIDTTWAKWKLRGYNYGFDPVVTPMYTTVNGILSTPYMVQVRGNENEKNMKRWGYHVFEGYANDDISRITMLVNKHIEEGKPLAEMWPF
jgi:hypothetical protein